MNTTKTKSGFEATLPNATSPGLRVQLALAAFSEAELRQLGELVLTMALDKLEIAELEILEPTTLFGEKDAPLFCGATLGQRLRLARMSAGLTQDALAEALSALAGHKISKGQISKWENDREEPNLVNLAAIAKHFRRSTDYFVNGFSEGE